MKLGALRSFPSALGILSLASIMSLRGYLCSVLTPFKVIVSFSLATSKIFSLTFFFFFCCLDKDVPRCDLLFILLYWDSQNFWNLCFDVFLHLEMLSSYSSSFAPG